MIGAIAGDVIGSVYESNSVKHKDFLLFSPDSQFTDDTILTVAVAEKLLRGGDYTDLFHKYYHAFPVSGTVAISDAGPGNDPVNHTTVGETGRRCE